MRKSSYRFSIFLVMILHYAVRRCASFSVIPRSTRRVFGAKANTETPNAVLFSAPKSSQLNSSEHADGTHPTTPPKSNLMINGTEISAMHTDITSTHAVELANGVTAPEGSMNVSSSKFDGNSILSIDPEDIVVVEEPAVPDDPTATTTSTNELLRYLPFVNMFRGSANYIANHRNTVAVYHIPGGLVHRDAAFRDLMNDVALSWLLGMKVVLIAGCRYQIEARMGFLVDDNNKSLYGTTANNTPKHSSETQHGGLRVTSADTLRVVKEEAGYVRFEVERQLARSLRLQGGGASDRKGNGFYDGNVVSGNFYSARPFGILNGVDYEYTGHVRKVEVEKIRKLHESRDICLMTTLGVSPSGEVFNVNSEALAAHVAGSLGARKVVYFTETDMDLRHKVHGNKIQSLRSTDARNLLEHYGLKMHNKGYVTLKPEQHENRKTLSPSELDMVLKIGWCCAAVGFGVKRAHIISPQHGALLQELYTRDGSGTLISADLYEGIRRATELDVPQIRDMIVPLIDAGILKDRPKAVLERDIATYYVYTRDNDLVACGQLKKFEDGFAEIGCLVVNSDFKGRGRGDAMLGYLERLCVRNECKSIFVLSTQTMEWFSERGFDEAVVGQLPPSRQETYNHKRASKIYLKKVENDRDLDASELWWNR